MTSNNKTKSNSFNLIKIFLPGHCLKTKIQHAVDLQEKVLICLCAANRENKYMKYYHTYRANKLDDKKCVSLITALYCLGTCSQRYVLLYEYIEWRLNSLKSCLHVWRRKRKRKCGMAKSAVATAATTAQPTQLKKSTFTKILGPWDTRRWWLCVSTRSKPFSSASVI